MSQPIRRRSARSGTRPASVAALGRAVVVSAVLSTTALAGCTSGSGPAPSPTSGTASASSSATASSSAPPTTTPTTTALRTSTAARYDVRTLIGSNVDDFPVGRPGPHGGVLLKQTVGTNAVSVTGATGPVSFYIPCCTDFAHLVLDYQVGSTRPVHTTQIPIDNDQGIVLDGRLIAIHGIMPVGSQPRVEAQVIVFPASAAAGLPIVK